MALLVDELVVTVPGAISVLVAVGVGINLTVEIAVTGAEAELSGANLGAEAEVPLTGDCGVATHARPGCRPR